LAVPRCRCTRPMPDHDGVCCRCGREIRLLGTLGRAWRRAAYDRQLRWARGKGLDPVSGFRGIAGEVGPNPDVDVLRGALQARLAALPFEDDLAA
jgi:hypothetical protein